MAGTTGMSLAGPMFNGPGAEKKRKPEDFTMKSSVDAWAAQGLGNPRTAVEGFVETFSALLYKEGSEVPVPELHRWLDTYYQLRRDAEKQADIAKFMANQSVTLEPVVPKVKAHKCKCDEAKPDDGVMKIFLDTFTALAFVGGLKYFYGPEVKDADEKEAAAEGKDEGKDEFYKLSPMGKLFAQSIAKSFKSEVEQAGEHRCCKNKDGHVAGDFICPHEREK